MCISYRGSISDRIAKILKRRDIKIYFKLYTKFSQVLRSDQDIFLESGGAYKVLCSCRKCYNGKTNRIIVYLILFPFTSLGWRLRLFFVEFGDVEQKDKFAGLLLLFENGRFLKGFFPFIHLHSLDWADSQCSIVLMTNDEMVVFET